MKALAPYIWPSKDVPAPDVNTNPQIMAWMLDEYEKVTGNFAPWVITGKPLSIGGSKWRWAATATGWFYVLEHYLTGKKIALSWKKVAVQWAGNAGLIFARLAVDAWAQVVAMSDSRGGMYNKEGLDISVIEQLKSSKKSVTDYPDGKVITNEDLLVLDVDILVPAALENQITENNAEHVQAQTIVELANGPTTPEADTILQNKWVVVIPDVLANAWGVTVSYFEQVQNNQNYYRDEEEVNTKLKRLMTEATTDVMSMAEKNDTSLRIWAYVVSLQRILEALKMRKSPLS